MILLAIDRFRNGKPCRVLVLTSPKAGSGAGAEEVPRLARLLDDMSIECVVTQTVEDLRFQLDRSRESHTAVVVACGGDGTVSLAASVISSLSTDANGSVSIVPMPLGTENLLARQFGHTAVAEAVIETIRHGARYELDEGVADARPFLIMATCGFDAEVVRRMHLTRRGHIRRLSYLRPILSAIGRYRFPTIQIRIDGDEPIEDVTQCIALLNVLPEAISPRMKHLESGLTGNRRMKVYVDIDELAERIDAIPGVAGVRLWDVPLLAEVYQRDMQRATERDPLIAFWYFSRWAILEAPIEMSQQLALARWRHLHGQFDDDDDENTKGARVLYLGQRAPEFEIEDLRIDVDLQQAYGVRRELGIDPEVYDRQLQQTQAMMRLGKRTATYWISLIHYDDERYDTAETWFSKRVLDQDQLSRWEPAARYNLARSIEHLGEPERAIELYKTDGDPQEHGNRIPSFLRSAACRWQLAGNHRCRR